MVYFVGDSRTIGLQWGLGSRKPSNVDFVADSGEGLEWFERRDDTGGYKNLYRKVRKIFENSGGRARQAVIINLGVKRSLEFVFIYRLYETCISTVKRRV